MPDLIRHPDLYPIDNILDSRLRGNDGAWFATLIISMGYKNFGLCSCYPVRKNTIVRSQLAKELDEEWGLSLTKTSRHLGVSPSAIAKTLYRLDKHKPS
jgi:hypothetical protein